MISLPVTEQEDRKVCMVFGCVVLVVVFFFHDDYLFADVVSFFFPVCILSSLLLIVDVSSHFSELSPPVKGSFDPYILDFRVNNFSII